MSRKKCYIVVKNIRTFESSPKHYSHFKEGRQNHRNRNEILTNALMDSWFGDLIFSKFIIQCAAADS